MVQLVLTSAKGINSSSRFFPHHGYLGLTPVTVEGIVRTRLEEDRKPLPAKSITISVRCYESRVSRSRGTVHSTLLVDYTDVLWSKPPIADWGDVADLELPFKLTLPKRTSGLSTANFQVYRTFWRVEATLEHIPITGVGHRLLRYFDLPLVRYDVPSHSVFTGHVPPAPPSHALYLQTTKPRAPVLRYTISTPSHPVGPNDMIFASLFLQPLDPSVSVRSATLVVERRIDLLNPSTSSLTSAGSPPPTPLAGPYLAPDDIPTPSSSSSHLDASTSPYDSSASLPSPLELTPSSSAATFESASSTRPLLSSSPPTPHTPSQSNPGSASDAPAKTLTSTVVSSECTGFSCDASGIWSKTLTLQWPAARPQSRWALGETMHTEQVAVRFFVRASVRVAGPAGADVLELEPREIAVTATSEAERRVALTRYAEMREGGGRSKSKSPWRARHGTGEREEEDVRAVAEQVKTFPGACSLAGGISAEDQGARTHRGHSHHHKGGASHSSMGTKSKTHLKAARRPHTSAGPSDKSNFAFATEDMRIDSPVSAREGRAGGRGHVRRESGLAESMLGAGGPEREREKEKEKERRAKTKERPAEPTDHVRAWEEELTRIELQSRRSSAHMLGSWGFPFGKRKQQVGVLQRG